MAAFLIRAAVLTGPLGALGGCRHDRSRAVASPGVAPMRPGVAVLKLS